MYSARYFLLKAFSKHALEHIIVKVQNHYNIKRASLIQDRRIGDAFMIFESMFENHSRILFEVAVQHDYIFDIHHWSKCQKTKGRNRICDSSNTSCNYSIRRRAKRKKKSKEHHNQH